MRIKLTACDCFGLRRPSTVVLPVVVCPITTSISASRGEINVHARSKFDESEVIIQLTSLFFSCVGHDTTCHCTGHLAYQHSCPTGGTDDDRAAFVFNAGFRQPRFGEVAIVMTHHFHDAFDGEPVGVHVGYRHKDAHHLTAVVEVFIFLPLLR